MAPYSYSFGAMGTSCTLQLFAESPEHAHMAAAVAVAEVERIEDKYSRFSPKSTLTALNQAAGKGETVEVDEETAGLLDYAFACYSKSNGLFDITAGILRRAWDFSSDHLPTENVVKSLLPLIGLNNVVWQRPCVSFAVPGMEMDFGGIGKEYAVDRLAVLLAAERIEHGLIDLGGDLFALGPFPDGQPWQIGLRDPQNTGTLVDKVSIIRGAMATSGDYERCLDIGGKRYGHILNPNTGWPAQGLSSVTALAPQCMVAGSVTTIAMLKGRDGIPWLASLGIPHRWIDVDGRQGGILPPIWNC